MREIQEVFDEYLSLAPKMAPDVILGVKSQHDPDQLCGLPHGQSHAGLHRKAGDSL